MVARFRKAGLAGLFLWSLLLIAIAASTGYAFGQPLLLEIEKAEASFDQRTGEPIMTIKLSKKSAKAFGEFTSKNLGRPAELRVDGKTVAKPVTREPILGGGFQISGSFTAGDAKALAAQLSTGNAKIEVEVVDK